MPALAKFLLHPAPLEKFLEPAQGRSNRLAIMDTHS
jgi:hypothetical protein